MCEYCEPPYEAMTRRWDNGYGGADSACYVVHPDAHGGPMLYIRARDAYHCTVTGGFVPVNFCPMCGRDLREAVSAG